MAAMARQYSVKQVLAFDNPALIQFMTDNRNQRGVFNISNITDWDHAPSARRRKLEGILAAAGPQAKASLDFTQLAAKLNGIREKRVVSSPEFSSPPLARPLSLSPKPGAGREHQIWCYHELLRKGGRPVCSLETQNAIYDNLEAHTKVLRPWLGDVTAPNPDDLGVFSRQLARWKEFREWQLNNRGGCTATKEDFAVFLDEKRRYFESTGLGSMTTAPNFEKTIRKRFQEQQTAHREQRGRIREACDGGGFAEYVRTAQNRLASHSFSQPFQLLEDHAEQDERVTWIEYLEFECWWLDEYTKSAQPRRKRPRDGDAEGDSQLESAKRRESNQQLRVQWVLGGMPPAKETPKSTAAEPDEMTRVTRKRRHPDGDGDNDEVSGEAADEAMGHTIKRQKQGKERGTRHMAAAGPKPASRMLLGLETPITKTRVLQKDGTRRSARLQEHGKKDIKRKGKKKRIPRGSMP